MKNAYNILNGKPEGNKVPKGPRRWDLEDRDCEDVEWIHLAKDTDLWRALVNMVMILWVPL
jgi:hypothetical protein